MNFIKLAIDFVLHLDKYLNVIISSVGGWTYLVLFFVIFIETGLVITPFLPGDSLLFAAGAVAALGNSSPVPGFKINVIVLYILVALAAVREYMARGQLTTSNCLPEENRTSCILARQL